MNQLIKHSANGNNFLIVEVHAGICLQEICECPPFLQYFSECEVYGVELPPGNYKILFIAEYATPDQAARVVGKRHKDNSSMWIDYQNDNWACMNAVFALQSLINANFSDKTKQHLIIQIL